MKMLEKQLLSKANFRIFWLLDWPRFELKRCERLRITKNVKAGTFEGLWSVLRESNLQNI